MFSEGGSVRAESHSLKRFDLPSFFLDVAGVLFLATALATLVSVNGSAMLLTTPDPIFGISIRFLLIIVATLEMITACILFFAKNKNLKSGVVAGLATCFCLYRLGLWSIHYQKPCNCLGDLTERLHISSHAADSAMELVLAYLLITGYAILLRNWQSKRRTFSITELAPTNHE
jgi:hypothetical protein